MDHKKVWERLERFMTLLKCTLSWHQCPQTSEGIEVPQCTLHYGMSHQERCRRGSSSLKASTYLTPSKGLLLVNVLNCSQECHSRAWFLRRPLSTWERKHPRETMYMYHKDGYHREWKGSRRGCVIWPSTCRLQTSRDSFIPLNTARIFPGAIKQSHEA